jgi:hypothetical protein
MEFAEQGFLRYEENGQKQGKGDKNQGKGNIDRKQGNEGKKDENSPLRTVQAESGEEDAVMEEWMKVNPDEFDYSYYVYGLRLLKKIPLIESYKLFSSRLLI